MDKVFNQAQAIISDYEERRKELEITYKNKLRDVLIPYVNKNARFAVGDVISSGKLIIKVEKIGARIYGNRIVPVYRGVALTKKLEKRKDNPIQGYEIPEDDTVKKLK